MTDVVHYRAWCEDCEEIFEFFDPVDRDDFVIQHQEEEGHDVYTARRRIERV